MAKMCPRCKTINLSEALVCSKCEHDLTGASESIATGNFIPNGLPGFCYVLRALAILCALGGIIAAIALRPNKYDVLLRGASTGLSYYAIATGIVSCLMFWFMGEVIKYLDSIDSKLNR